MTMHLRNNQEANNPNDPKPKRMKMVSQYKLATMPQRDDTEIHAFSENVSNGLLVRVCMCNPNFTQIFFTHHILQTMTGRVNMRVDAQPQITAEYKALMEARVEACKPGRETLRAEDQPGLERFQRHTFKVIAAPALKADPVIFSFYFSVMKLTMNPIT